MSLRLHRIHGPQALFPAWATRAPLAGLSCHYRHRDAVRRPYEEPRPHRSFRAFGPKHRGGTNPSSTADAGRWCDYLTTDDCHRPTAESQRARPRILGVIIACVLAVILIHAGW